MSDSFKNLFKKEIELETEFGPVMRFAMMRERAEYKWFVFVEGSTDKIFYENTNISELSDHAYYFFRTLSDGIDADDYQGKESVYYSLKRIVENEKLNQTINKCRFIIDRDYERVKRSKTVRLKPQDYARVNVTKGHSMESYFLEKNNLEIVLRLMGLNMDDFLKVFDPFAKEMSTFYAYRAAITSYHSSGANIRYQKKYPDEELFLFNFSEADYWMGKNKVQEECQRMKRAFEQYSYLQRQANLLQEEIASNRMYIRGHDAFSFLEQYIKQKASRQISFPYGDKSVVKEMIGRFNVELTT